jgi:hypothetical protein
MNNIEHLEQLQQRLDQMLSDQKEKKNRTFVAKYKGKNIRTRSGKSSWKAVNHAKAALLLHFSHLEHQYVYYDYRNRVDRVWNKFSSYETDERRKQFREKLWEMIEIVELE